MAKLIFGCGYLGSRVARLWCDAGEEVIVVTRNSERARELAAAGYATIVADVLNQPSLANLPVADTVLYAIGYDRSSGGTMHEVFVAGLRSVLDALPPETGILIYISSTGVYGQSHGQWVDEDSPCEPQREGGLACLAAEQALAAHPLGVRAIVLRMAGLYGPGRVPYIADIRDKKQLAVPQQGYLNLIHIDDAARVVLAADQYGQPPRTYAVSDSQPVERRAYLQEIARLLGAASPTFATPPADSAAASRAVADKRVNNTRMAAELHVALAYPSFRQGLAAIVAEESPPATSR